MGEEKGGGEREEYVVLSKVRTGLKREFEFALRSQNEICGVLGRTRAQKRDNQSPIPTPIPKRRKKVVVVVEKEKERESSREEEEETPESDVVDEVGEEEEREGSGSQCESKEREMDGGDCVGDVDPVVEDESDNVEKEKEVKKVEKVKVPRVLNELLETGLLEGMKVTYVRGARSKGAPIGGGGLAGVIKGSGILCFCKQCKGKQVVKASQFEMHAGSANKRASDYTYLENGKNLRYVIDACKGVKPDSVVVTILNAIGSSSKEKQLIVCLKCKKHMPKVRSGITLICKSCANLEASQTTPSKEVAVVKRSDEPISVRKSSYSAPKASSLLVKCQGKITRKDLRLHKLVFQNDFLPDGTEVGYYQSGKKILSGYKKGYGIYCFCCKEEVSPSQFEAHAGFASRRKPYLNIYTSNGASLHELSLSLSRMSDFSTNENDDLCSLCHGEGDLLCCDGCPRAFHIECIPLASIPQEKWFCQYCEDMFRKEKDAGSKPNAIAAGRVPGVDPVEQITNRCIRIVTSLDTQDGDICALCSDQDFTKSGFGPRTVIICDQCEKEYHIGCLSDHKMHYLKELPAGDWLCSSDCERILNALKELVDQGEQKLPDHLFDIIKKKYTEQGLNYDDLDIRWRISSGKMSSVDEIQSLLSKAVSVFHEQFDPILYGNLKQDLIPHMVYGRSLKEREFGGMFCATLSVNSTIVSSGILRVFGVEIAEVPLVATSKDCEGKGYFQCLYNCIERLLEDLGVKKILLPAAEEAMSLWTSRFGFDVMPKEELDQLRRHYAPMVFEGTSMLHKLVAVSTA